MIHYRYQNANPCPHICPDAICMIRLNQGPDPGYFKFQHTHTNFNLRINNNKSYIYVVIAKETFFVPNHLWISRLERKPPILSREPLVFRFVKISLLFTYRMNHNFAILDPVDDLLFQIDKKLILSFRIKSVGEIFLSEIRIFLHFLTAKFFL